VVSPSHHFPLGVVLSPERRRALVAWAVGGDRLVIEHDYDGHYRYDRPPVGALQEMAPDHVVYVGSSSGLLAPTLRLGWAVLPAQLVIPTAARTFVNLMAVPRLSQLAFAEFIARGYLDRHLRKAQSVYKRRRLTLLQALARHLPKAAVGGAQVGLFVSATLPPETDEAELLWKLRGLGFRLEGAAENARLAHPPGLALGFAASSEATLRRAIRELAAALTSFRGCRS
jgi:GntR family transcriptional regulator/MocR family aminotransferase